MSLDSFDSVRSAAMLAGIDISGKDKKAVEKAVVAAANKLRQPQENTGYRPILPAANSTLLARAVAFLAIKFTN